MARRCTYATVHRAMSGANPNPASAALIDLILPAHASRVQVTQLQLCNSFNTTMAKKVDSRHLWIVKVFW